MEPNPEKILRTPEVERLTGLDRVTIWRLARTDPPRFPRPLQLSDRAVGWRHSDVLLWLASRPEANGRKAAGGPQ
jgi:prophage regulatory protein